MANIRAISFDLDNTLWDIVPVIDRAEKNSQSYIERHYPKIAERYSLEDVRRLRERNQIEYPEIRHDLTEQRRRIFHQLLNECGYDASQASVLLERFLADRNDVELFPDVLPALKRLSRDMPLVSLSDGNACLDSIGIGKFFTASISAAEIGAMKPDPRGFQQVCSVVGLPASDILYVGDHPQYDMFGARNAGMQTMWMVRSDEIANSWNQQFEPDYRGNSLYDIVDLVC